MGFFSKLFSGNKAIQQQPKRQPEDEYVTEITDLFVRVCHPTRAPEQIAWHEVEEVLLVNTDEGPFLPDVWLILKGHDKGCSIPHGSAGWDPVYNIVSQYEGFDFEKVIESASCTDNAVFVVWKK